MADRVKISKIKRLHLESLALASYRDGKETGGYLAGICKDNIMYIQGIVDAGPNAKRHSACFEPDYAYAAKKLRLLRDQQGQHLIGGWHTHNGFGSELSYGDVVTLREVAGEYPDFISVLINVDNGECLLNAFCLLDGEVRRLTLEETEDQELSIKKPDIIFKRIEKLYSHQFLNNKSVLIIGLGSGGSVVAPNLARTGIGSIGLMDHEKIEEVNLIRHTATYKDIGKRKTDVVYYRIKNINKTIKAKRYNLKAGSDTVTKLKNIMKDYDLIVSCTGHPLANNLINSFCLDLKIPAVYAGVFSQASAGFVLKVVPDETCCLNCIYDYTKLMVSDTNENLQKTKERYGITEKELSSHQGLFVDISFIALLQAKFALLTLLVNQEHHLGNPSGNFIVWNSQTCSSSCMNVSPRTDCSVCSKAWSNAQPNNKSSIAAAGHVDGGFDNQCED